MRALPGRSLRQTVDDATLITPREQTRRDQRRRILRAAGELIAKRGYNAVTADMIVKRARVSPRTFYVHYRSKEDCFLALFDAVFARVQASVRAALEEEMPWPEQVIATLQVIGDLVQADPLIARAIVVEAPTAGPVVFERYENANRALAPLFRRGREFHPHGEALPSTLELTLAGSVVWSAYQRIIVGEADRIEAVLPEVVELVLRPYLGDEEAARHARESAAPARPAAS
jgi:AcrR family transcriptional regulator